MKQFLIEIRQLLEDRSILLRGEIMAALIANDTDRARIMANQVQTLADIERDVENIYRRLQDA